MSDLELIRAALESNVNYTMESEKGHRNYDRFVSHAKEALAAFDQLLNQEPASYQSRLEFSFGWGEWTTCTQACFQEFIGPDKHAGRYPVEVRALYASPLAQPKVPDYASIADAIQIPDEVKGRFSSEMFWRGVYAMRDALLSTTKGAQP